MPTQHLNIYITYQNIVKQWPFVVVRKSLTAAEQQALYSDGQACCSDELQYLGFPNPSQLIAVSASYLNQPNHKA